MTSKTIVKGEILNEKNVSILKGIQEEKQKEV